MTVTIKRLSTALLLQTRSWPLEQLQTETFQSGQPQGTAVIRHRQLQNMAATAGTAGIGMGTDATKRRQSAEEVGVREVADVCFPSCKLSGMLAVACMLTCQLVVTIRKFLLLILQAIWHAGSSLYADVPAGSDNPQVFVTDCSCDDLTEAYPNCVLCYYLQIRGLLDVICYLRCSFVWSTVSSL
jgi:hypothetical protein